MLDRRNLLKNASSLVLTAPALAWGAGSQDTTPTSAQGSDWPVASADSVGMSASTLDAVLDQGADMAALRAVVVVRRGKLIAERYFARAHASLLLPVFSVTKSVASLLVGQAIAQGKIIDLDQTVASLLPAGLVNPTAAAAQVSLRQILTGTTGLAYDWRAQSRALASAADPTGYVMGLPKSTQAAGAWSYNDAAVSLLTPILEHAHGKPVAEVAKRDLFDPLGIERFDAQKDRAGHVMSYAGLQLRPRDAAKIGWMVADGGRWNGRQIVPADWVAQSTQSHASPDWRVNPVTSDGYGYLWFTGQIGTVPVAWALGYGAQIVLVAPSLQLVVTTNAMPPEPQQLSAQNDVVMGLVSRVIALAT